MNDRNTIIGLFLFILLTIESLLFADDYGAGVFNIYSWRYIESVGLTPIYQHETTGKYRVSFSFYQFDVLSVARRQAQKIENQRQANYDRMMKQAEERWNRIQAVMDSAEYKRLKAEQQAIYDEAWDYFKRTGKFPSRISMFTAEQNRRLLIISAQLNRMTTAAMWGYSMLFGASTSSAANSTEANSLKSLFRSFDEDRNGELTWTEIRRFQAWVSDNLTYSYNRSVLTPEQFRQQGTGDCDDFAAFSCAFLREFGYEAYVAVLSNGDDQQLHAVAAVCIGDSEYSDGYSTFKGAALYNPKSRTYTRYLYPSGNYVFIDFWKIGYTIEPFKYLKYMIRYEEAIGAPL